MKYLAPATLFLSVLALVFAFSQQAVPAYGSVSTGSEYNYATTSAAGSQLVRTTFNSSPGCVLGSIVIASSSAAAFTVYNATSTTDVNATVMAVFEPNAAEGTYTFDVACTRGITLTAASGFNGYVITTHR